MHSSELREVEAGSTGYLELLDLRFEQLRKPLGLQWTREELEADQGDRHFGLFEEGHWVAVAVAHQLDQAVVKLRQIAVDQARQGQGLGRRIMAALEEPFSREGTNSLILHARLSVAGFYEAIGYRPEGDIFEEIGVPHIRMRKSVKGGST